MVGLSAAQYLLRWNDHLTNYGDIFLTLREEEEFLDCSIACEDGVVGAHRVVLAGCSQYLRDLFARVDNPHPIIFLINTPRSLVLLLMEFIYRGQVHIQQNRLRQLVTLGCSLKIKGLSQIMVPNLPYDDPDSLTPMAFPQGLPLSAVSSFSDATSGLSELNVSIQSYENDEVAGDRDEDKEEEEKEESMDEEAGTSHDQEGEGKENGFASSDPAVGKICKTRGRKKKVYQSVTKIQEDQEEYQRTVRKKPQQKDYSDYIRSFKSSNCLYTSIVEKCRVGCYAQEHGIEAAKKHVNSVHNVRIRNKTLMKLIRLHKRHQGYIDKRKKRKGQLKHKESIEDNVSSS